jgi:hypothetical protein
MMSGTVVSFETYRISVDDVRDRPAADPPPVSPFARLDEGPRRPLSARQVAHRLRMLEHLQRHLTRRPSAISPVSTAAG